MLLHQAQTPGDLSQYCTAGTVVIPAVPHLSPACATRQAWPGSLVCPPSLSGSLLQLRLYSSAPWGSLSASTEILATQIMEAGYDTTYQGQDAG